MEMRLNQKLRDVNWLTAFKNKTQQNATCKKLIFPIKTCTDSERMENDFLSKWNLKVNRNSYAYV